MLGNSANFCNCWFAVKGRACLTAVGLSSVPSWCKPYEVLSAGERFRAGFVSSPFWYDMLYVIHSESRTHIWYDMYGQCQAVWSYTTYYINKYIIWCKCMVSPQKNEMRMSLSQVQGKFSLGTTASRNSSRCSLGLRRMDQWIGSRPCKGCIGGFFQTHASLGTFGQGWLQLKGASSFSMYFYSATKK